MSDEGPNDVDKFYGEPESRNRLYPGTGTETIGIEGLTFDQLTESGSFDLRGFRLTSVGRLFNALPLIALLVGSDHRIVFANELACNLVGEGGGITGGYFTALFPRPPDASRADEILTTVFRERKLRVGEGAVELGVNRMWGRMNFRPVRVGNGRFVLVLVEDLTLEKKHLYLIERHKELMRHARDTFEKELRRKSDELGEATKLLEQERARRTAARPSPQFDDVELRGIVETMHEGILVFDRDEVVVFANPAAARMFDRSRVAVLGQKLPISLVPGQAVELEITRHNGERGLGEARVERSEWQEKPAYLTVIHDITDMKRSESHLLKAQKLESLELIAGGVAHDLNNLLTANIANISLAKMRAAPDTRFVDALTKAEKAAFKAKDLTGQLLAFTKDAIPIKRPTPVGGLIEDCVSLSLVGSNVRCRVNLAEDLWTVEGEPSQLGMVFRNLLINARQAMPEGGHVDIEADNIVANLPAVGKETRPAQKKYVRISFRDAGPGIPPEILSKIFEPYFTTKPQGSGLGLATVHSVVQTHGGRIEVKSHLGKGTSFYVYLPASEFESVVVDPDSDTSTFKGSGRILVIEQESETRDQAASGLKLMGYHVECVANQDEALEKCEFARRSSTAFDAVIVHFAVSEESGPKIVERIREVDPDVNLILSTGPGISPSAEDLRRYGVKGLIRKPYSAEDVDGVLRTVRQG